LVHPFPSQHEENEEYLLTEDLFLSAFELDLEQYIDPDLIELKGEFPYDMLDVLKEKGYYGICVEKRYGGLGLSYKTFLKAMSIASGRCPAFALHLGTHQVIGLVGTLGKIFTPPGQRRTFWICGNRARIRD
jgi:alkylation response protein AidB-like acyl-CoA dehydrogenase